VISRKGGYSRFIFQNPKFSKNPKKAVDETPFLEIAN